MNKFSAGIAAILIAVAWTASAHAATLAAAGDIACGAGSTGASCKQSQTAALLAGANAVAPLGDNQYEAGALSDFQAFYAPTWGKYFSITHPAVGNHEYLTPGAAGFLAYFKSLLSTAHPTYYSYSLGGWHIDVLDSDCGKVGGCSATSPQGKWLAADLAAHPTACSLAYWHHPRWSVGPQGDTPSVGPLVQILYNAGAEILLVGHDHSYQRWAPRNPSGQTDTARGIREFVVGTGGRNVQHVLTTSRAGLQVVNDRTFGVLKLTLGSGSYSWRFVPIPGQSFTDSGSGTCH